MTLGELETKCDVFIHPRTNHKYLSAAEIQYELGVCEKTRNNLQNQCDRIYIHKTTGEVINIWPGFVPQRNTRTMLSLVSLRRWEELHPRYFRIRPNRGVLYLLKAKGTDVVKIGRTAFEPYKYLQGRYYPMDVLWDIVGLWESNDLKAHETSTCGWLRQHYSLKAGKEYFECDNTRPIELYLSSNYTLRPPSRRT